MRMLINAINATVASFHRTKGRFTLDEMIDAQLDVLFNGLEATPA